MSQRIVVIFYVLCCGAMAAKVAAHQPNIVLIMIDDMGWADWERSALNPDGSDVYETPNMHRLAERGVVFNNGYASAPVCSPTRVSLMTGKNAARHRVTDFIGAGNGGLGGFSPPTGWSQNLGASETTLPEAMRASGYNTAFFGKWHLGQTGNAAADPLQNGFDTNVGGVASGNPGFAGGFFAGSDGAWAGMPGLDTPGTYASTDYLSDALSSKAADYIGQQATSSQPFFLNLSHYVVHTPIQAPADLVAKYTDKIAALQSQNVDLRGHTNPTYAGMVEKMDQSLGVVLDRLEDPNNDGDNSDSIRDDTIVLFTSDNGGLTRYNVTSNRPLREGKGSMYEGGIREPYIVSWTGSPSVNQGVLNQTRVSTHDIYPTLLELAGVTGDAQQNSQMDGVSFAPALAGQTLDRGPQLWHYPHYSPQDAGDNGQVVDGGQFVSAVRDGDWKLLWFYERGQYELYNLAADPGETTNVLMANPEKALELSTALRSRLTETDAQMPNVRFGSAPAQPTEPPPLAILNRPPEFDPFGTAQDFLTAGVSGTPWAGVGNASTATTLESSGGKLTMQNAANTNLNGGGFNAPLLYETVSGDFDAQMEVASMTSTNFHVLAIVAADPNGDIIWIGQQDRTGDLDFAQSRSYEGASRIEQNLSGKFSHYRLVREGDEFRGYVSQDGLFWRQISEFNRPDMPNELRVGIGQASFGGATVTAEIEAFSLAPFTPLPGDYNNDGQVNAADYTLWRNTLGSQADLRADGDRSGTIDAGDYALWRSQFGAALPTLAALSSHPEAVPEPCAMGIAMIAVAAGASHRYRRNHPHADVR